MSIRGRKKFIILICVAIFIIFRSINYIFEHVNDVNVETEKNFQNILQYMLRVEAFLIDVNVLNEIDKIYSVKNLKKLLKKNDGYYLTFGIDSKNQKLIKPVKSLRKMFNMICKELISESMMLDTKVITHYFITCGDGLTAQIAVFHQRSDFYWIGPANEKTVLFGDLPRALHQHDLRVFPVSDDLLMLVPSDIKKFIFDYKYSRFLECNKSLAAGLNATLGSKFTKDPDELATIRDKLKIITQRIEGLYKPYALWSGTLLGWYRQCGIIQHTNDVDIVMRIDDFDDRIMTSFLGNAKLPLILQFGFKGKGYELRLEKGHHKFDLFTFSDYNLTHWWTGYHALGMYYKAKYTRFDDFCSCELLGTKFLIPCDPIKSLIENYGMNFTIPNTKDNWNSFSFDEKYHWSNSEWPNIIKFYNKYGIFDSKETAETLDYYYHAGNRSQFKNKV